MDKGKQEQTSPLSGFDLFWSRYPTKFNRAHAQAIWDDIDPTPAQQEAFLGALTIEAGDRERARRAGRQLPTKTGALWLMEHRDLGEGHLDFSPLQAVRAAAGRLRGWRLEMRCGGGVRPAASCGTGLLPHSTLREGLDDPMERRFLHGRVAAADGSQGGVVGRDGQRIDAGRRIHADARQFLVQLVDADLPGPGVQREVVALRSPMALGLDGRLDEQRDGRRDGEADSCGHRPLRLFLQGGVGSSAAADELDEVQGDVEPRVQTLAEVVEPIAVPDIGDHFAVRDVTGRDWIAHFFGAHFSVPAQVPAQDLQEAAAVEFGFSHGADRSSI
ncbi:MAG: hypothetical protein EOO81_06650, partial [Oxalobacteraceae bacterium]